MVHVSAEADHAAEVLHLPSNSLSLSLAFDYPTLRKLTQLLAQLRAEQVTFAELHIPSRDREFPESKTCRLGVQAVTAKLADGSEHQQFLQTTVIGCDAAIVTPLARWDVHAHTQSVTHHGSFLAEIGLFDPAYFKMSAAEAAVIDPGQRLVLQCAGEVLPQKESDSAVVIAQFQNDWSLLTCSQQITTSQSGAGVCALAALQIDSLGHPIRSRSRS